MILLVANSTWNLYHYRQPLIVALLAQGYQVETAAPADDFLPQLEQLTHSKHHALQQLNPQSQNQLSELGCLLEIKRLYQRLQPSLVLHFTIKPNIYGGLAARWLGIPYMAVITGLGYTFLHDSWTNRLIPGLYRLGLASAKQVIFYNQADQAEFIQRRISKAANSTVINGSGVDLSYFKPSPLPQLPIFRCLYVGRLLKDKGLRELVVAVSRLYAKGYSIQLTLLGSPEVLNPEAISAEELLRYAEDALGDTCTCAQQNPYPCIPAKTNEQSSSQNTGLHHDAALTQPRTSLCLNEAATSAKGKEQEVATTTVVAVQDANHNGRSSHHDEASCHCAKPLAKNDVPIHFTGPVEDVRPFFASHHLFVLPSYREGLSRAGAEALACGRPVLVSDVPGCRELVNEAATNGRLVAPRSASQLMDALAELYTASPDALAAMGQESRALAEAQFGAAAVSKVLIQQIQAILAQ